MMNTAGKTLRDAEGLARDDKWEDAERVYRSLAESGDPRAWMAIGRHYCEPEHNDLTRALECFERAADMGSADGAFQAAYLWAGDKAGEKDMKRSLLRFDQAAAAGGCIAYTRAGWIRLRGDSEQIDIDVPGAVVSFKRAVELEQEPEAMLGLGYAYSEGRIERDVPAAVYWFKWAVLESEKLQGLAKTEARREMFGSWAAEGARGVSGLLEELIALAEDGDANAAYEVGHAISQRFHPPCKEVKSAEWWASQAAPWYARAAESGHFEACEALGKIHREGLGVEKDPQKAVDLLWRAADAGHAQAFLELAHLYRLGNDVEKDEVKARELYRRAAETGDPGANHDYAYSLFCGLGGERDEDGAMKHYRVAAEAGMVNSMVDLAVGLETRDPEECTQWLVRAAEKGDLRAMLWLAKRYRDGVGTDVDRVQATRWFFAPLLQGNGDGIHEIHQYVTSMTPDQVREAARLAGVHHSYAESVITTFTV